VRTAIRSEAVAAKLKAGDIEGARQIATLGEVAIAQAELGDVAGALATASGIAQQRELDAALWAVALAKARLGNAQSVLAMVARRGESQVQQIDTLVQVVRQLVDRQPAEARGIVGVLTSLSQ